MSRLRHFPGLTAAVLVTGLVTGLSLSGCSSDESGAEELPGNTPSASADQQAAFVLPEKGESVGKELRSRPADKQTAGGATDFASWVLGIVAYTPRSDASCKLWATTYTNCVQCQKVATAWQQQADADQEFTYASTPKFAGVATAAAKQGPGWFVQLEADVPVASLTEAGKPVQKTKAERLGYSFTLAWKINRWTVADFRVLATGATQ